MDKSKNKVFWEGFHDGIPIGLGYFAVAFSLGILAQKAGVSIVQGFFASFFCVASAGENALFSSIQAAATFIEIAVITLVVNARYMLMSCALSQRFDEETPFFHRFFVGFGVTDEIFAISIARPGFVNPLYNYGAISIAVPLWSLGTALGIAAGGYLPARIVSAFSVALYGMFIAIFIPPAKKDKVIAGCVLASFALSFACSVLPGIKNLSGGNRTILLTVVIAALAAVIKPVEEETEQTEKVEDKNE